MSQNLTGFLRIRYNPHMSSYGNVLHSPWLKAIRLKTLPAAASPVITGSALAYADHSLNIIIACACLLCAVLLQIGSNLANDVFDFERGADAGVRLGPTRVTQSGLLTPFQVKIGMWIVFGITALIGLYLTLIGGWPVLVLGIAAILSAIAYTGGPYPLGYHGFGDLFVFIFFGLGATVGTYYLQCGFVLPKVWWMASAMGCLTVCILVVNNLRDIESDSKVNKMTLAVLLGNYGTQIQYYVLMSLSYCIPIIIWVLGLSSPWGLMIWITFPLAIYWMRYISKNSGKSLNKALAGTGQLELLYAVIFTVGMYLSIITSS